MDLFFKNNLAVSFSKYDRLLKYLNHLDYDGPRTVVDSDLVVETYKQFQTSFDFCDIFYAVKSNPEQKILNKLAEVGCNFDVASLGEIVQVEHLNSNINFGNTIKKSDDIRKAHQKGISSFTSDSIEDLIKIHDNAPGSDVYLRILIPENSAKWPLSKKFGTSPDMVSTLMNQANKLDLNIIGLSFHVGSQQLDPTSWDKPLEICAEFYKKYNFQSINIGGGFVSYQIDTAPPICDYGREIYKSLKQYYGKIPHVICEPGRGLVADSGILQTQVILNSSKEEHSKTRWLFLDSGRYHGLAETLNDSIKYKITDSKNSNLKQDFFLAGPSCDSTDMLLENSSISLSKDLQEGDFLYFFGAGAYTTTYSSGHNGLGGFNGIPGIKSIAI